MSSMKTAVKVSISVVLSLAVLSLFSYIAFSYWRIAGIRQYEFSVESDVTYKSVGSVQLTGDLYRPSKPGAKPAIIVVHGGSWQKRAGDMEWISRALAGNGYVVFNISYRFAPEYRYPAPVEDVQDAIRWLRSNSHRLEIDPSKIAGWGYSAGSQLILRAALSPDSPDLKLHAIVAGGTPADLTAWPNSPIVTAYIGKPFSESKEIWLEASPISHVRADSPPLFMYHGADDDFVEPEQVQRMNAAFQKWNRSVIKHIAHGLGHAGTYLFDRESEDLALQFLNSQLR